MSAPVLAVRPLLVALAAAIGLAAPWPTASGLGPAVALAQDEEAEEDGGDGEGEGESDGEGDAEGEGEGDGGDAEEEEDDEEEGGEEGEDGEEAPEQPPVTAGGLFTRKTFPIAENERPLTITDGMFEATAGFNIDLSDKEAFETWFGVLRTRYGLADNLELQVGTLFKLAGVEGGAAGPNKGRLDVGIEPALVYDMVDFRFTVEMKLNPDTDEPFKIDLALGFPFRYKPAKQFAIVALDRLMTIHTSESDGKPDLTAGVGVVIQPAPIVAILLRAEITIPRFDTTFVAIPATAAVQLTPDNRFDVGLEFTFANVKPTEAESMADIGPLDRRFLLLYASARF